MTEYQKREIAAALPTGTNTLGNVKVTDGTNFLPTMDAVARAGFVKITDGTDTADVTANALRVVLQDGNSSYLADVIDGGQDSALNSWRGLIAYGMNYGFNGTSWDRLRCDTNKYLYTTIGSEIPAGTQLIGIVKIGDGTETATVTADGYLDVKTHSPEKYYCRDFLTSKTDFTIITPPTGKKILIECIYISTNTITVDVVIKAKDSGKILFKLYTSRLATTQSSMYCGCGDTDEEITITCGKDTYVNIGYAEK